MGGEGEGGREGVQGVGVRALTGDERLTVDAVVGALRTRAVAVTLANWTDTDSVSKGLKYEMQENYNIV